MRRLLMVFFLATSPALAAPGEPAAQKFYPLSSPVAKSEEAAQFIPLRAPLRLEFKKSAVAEEKPAAAPREHSSEAMTGEQAQQMLSLFSAAD